MASREELSFVWSVGIEDTMIPTRLRGGEILNEHDLTEHRDRWREDIELAAGVGATAVRYGLPWAEVNPGAGSFVWDRADEVLGRAAEVGLEIVLDLVHYGTPSWLDRSFVDPRYPEAIASYAGALAERYRGVVRSYTPLNEPLVTASFCGLRGVWPPYLTGDAGWASVVASVVEGVQQTVRAIRAADGGARIVHVEAVQLYDTDDSELESEVGEWTRRSMLPTSLLLGRLDDGDAMWGWLARHAVGDETLVRLREGGVSPDVLGLNYYPELSPRELVRRQGRTLHVAQDRRGEGLATAIRMFHEAYGLPIMVTETAVEGDGAHMSGWLDEAVETLRRLDEEGIPVVGLTWWPLFDFVDWSWASGGDAVEEFYIRDNETGEPRAVPPQGVAGGPVDPFLRRMGLFRLDRDASGGLERVATSAADAFRRHAARSSADREGLRACP
jgi:beta-glucosidase/6-phospho-beta-glucosidase/beta-galactosidase